MQGKDMSSIATLVIVLRIGWNIGITIIRQAIGRKPF